MKDRFVEADTPRDPSRSWSWPWARVAEPAPILPPVPEKPAVPERQPESQQAPVQEKAPEPETVATPEKSPEPEPPAPRPPMSRALRNRRLWQGLWILFFIALALRFYHLVSHHWPGYSHDAASHAAYAGYIRTNFHLPPVDDDFEYPQQPLYYILAAPLYHTQETFDQNQEHLAPFGFFISVLAITLTFRSLRYLSSWLLRYAVFCYVAFIPAFVLASSYIGNDGLALLTGTALFYCVVRFNRHPRDTRLFTLALVVLFAALLTKLNGIVLLAALPWLLWRRACHEDSWKPTLRRFATVVVLLALWSGGILWRAWVPPAHQFVFSHAWVWDFMKMKESMLIFPVRFDLSSLIAAGQATTVDNTPDAVRFSFPSWEYGNMLLGEYTYNDDPTLLFFSQLLIVSGTGLLFGLLLFTFISLLSRPFRPWRELLSLNRTVLALIVGGNVLVLAFLHSAPAMCNADFRYQAFAFIWIGYGIGRGLCAFPRSSFWNRTMATFLCLFVGASWIFLTALYIKR